MLSPLVGDGALLKTCELTPAVISFLWFPKFELKSAMASRLAPCPCAFQPWSRICSGYGDFVTSQAIFGAKIPYRRERVLRSRCVELHSRKARPRARATRSQKYNRPRRCSQHRSQEVLPAVSLYPLDGYRRLRHPSQPVPLGMRFWMRPTVGARQSCTHP